MTATPAGKPELLAPAGSLDAFATAIEAGADAIYIGAPQLNARALARHFTAEELAAMIDYGHRHRVKVYVAMNSLVREEEIPGVVELLAWLERLGPDALIIQDLGLYALVRHHFPSFTLHASTLMGAHNSLAVQQFAEMGFRRVVLAREVTLAEIGAIHAQCAVELEVFVHGALCFSYSGLCLFSSYLGGKSGLRGRCVQPCRRKYSWSDGRHGQPPGYFFSMNDLEAIELLPQLTAAGVVSFKIEGRMRSASYVGAVVKAYRQVIDAGERAAEVLPQARRLLRDAMGRRPTAGYFLSPNPADAVTPLQTGNIGQFLGRVTTVSEDAVSLVLQEAVAPGDRVRLHEESSGERSSFTVREILQEGRRLASGEKGEAVTLRLTGVQAEAGDALYKVDVQGRRRMEAAAGRVTPPGSSFKRLKESAGAKARSVLQALAAAAEREEEPRTASRRPEHARGRPAGKDTPLPVWLRYPDLRLLNQTLVDRPERLLVTLDPENYRQVKQQKSQLTRLKTLTWVLPPVILEAEVAFYRQAVAELLKEGFSQWMISHLGQLQLFRPPEKEKRRGPGRGRVQLAGNYTLNVLNSLAAGLLRGMNVDPLLLSIEADREALAGICAQKRKGRVGLVVFGRPPLFTSRLQPEFFQFNHPFISPRGERFELVRKWGQTMALPAEPFSLLPRQSDVKRAGLDFMLIDLTFVALPKKEMARLRRMFAARGKGHAPESFNFFRTLQ